MPGPLPGQPEASTVPDPMGVIGSSGKPEASAPGDFFPIPGDSADWTSAFTLEGSANPLPRPDGAVSVAGKSTLWRQVPVPPTSPSYIPPPQPSDIHKRLDALTRQLESLTSSASSASSPMQSTAELFLFIAIGLLLILALDTLLRCATAIAIAARASVGGARLTASAVGRGFSLGRRWRG